MALQQKLLVVGETIADKVVLLYQGKDSGEAAVAFLQAGDEYREVGLLPKGQMMTKLRYPGKEAIAAKQSEADALARHDAELNRKKAEAASKTAAAKKLAAEATALQKEIDDTTNTGPLPPLPGKSQPASAPHLSKNKK